MLVKCPNCKREIETSNDSVLVMCRCGECAYDKDAQIDERRYDQNGNKKL